MPYKHIRSKAYYGCLNSLDKNDERVPRYKEHLKENGWEPSELWSLDMTIARFIVPRLEAFLSNTGWYVKGSDQDVHDRWVEDSKKVLEAMKIIADGDCPPFENKEKEKIVENGLALFHKVFLGWWN